MADKDVLSDVRASAPPIRVVLISLDSHIAAGAKRAEAVLRTQIPGLTLDFHAAANWNNEPETLQECLADINRADIVIATMLFLDDQIEAVRPALEARHQACDAMVVCLSAGDIVKLTRLGKFRMDKPESGAISVLKRLRGNRGKQGSSGANQMKMLRRLPRMLKYIPGTAQDVRAYLLTLQYWLSGSDENIAGLVAFLVNRYAAGERSVYRGAVTVADPVNYPDIGLYHPDIEAGVTEHLTDLPGHRQGTPTVGLLLMRSYLLAKDTRHYDGVIRAMEAKGLRVIPAYAGGLDARPAIDRYFLQDGKPAIDAMVSLTGFSLVGGPAYNDPAGAAEILGKLDIPYIAAQALEFQTLNHWGSDTKGLTPVEATMMVAIPELDGATVPMVYGGRSGDDGQSCAGCGRACQFDDGAGTRRMESCPERAEMLAARTHKLVRLRNRARQDRKVAIVLFNFPPNSGATGTAAYLDVFASLHGVLKTMAAEGYGVDVPPTVEDLRHALLAGNAEQFGTDANVHDHLDVATYVRGERRLNAIEAQWGPAPGQQQTDGKHIHILGKRFGNVFIGIQPAFGYEGDPMRLLFEQGFAPTHAFAAFYRWIREVYDADAVLHFGTHGALEFMPGKHTALSGDCWPDYLMGDVPNLYYYAANNPSEAAIAKRRAAATTISYLTPSVAKAGLYKDLSDLKSSIERYRGLDPKAHDARQRLVALIQTQAAELELTAASPAWEDCADREIRALTTRLGEYESTLIPHGLHVAGVPPTMEERREILLAHAVTGDTPGLSDMAVDLIVSGASRDDVARTHPVPDAAPVIDRLVRLNASLMDNGEIPAILRALDGRFVPPVCGGDLIANPEIVPAGRNIHGFDPFRMPSAFAVKDGAAQADRLLQAHCSTGAPLPETVAIVLWGTDNLKSEGAQLSQALALLGARPRFDSYGRLCGAELIPMRELNRPRIDVVVTLSGIFRDLLPLQSAMLAKACLLAATAEESIHLNFVRKHALAYAERLNCSLETAALRVFSNAEGAYGANVNHLIDAGCWENEDELADAYAKRKCYAYGPSGKPSAQHGLLDALLHDVDLAYQNLESVELGVTTVDHYFDTLGGIGRAVKRARGHEAPVYIGDQTRGDGKVRTLAEQVALEARTRTLNPKWYESMLTHGYEGVRQIEAQVTNTMGWSATTGQVAPWVYEKITETFVLDTALRDRLATLNPKACARVANRLLEASDRQYWQPDDETLDALQRASEDLEDRIEGIAPFSPAPGSVPVRDSAVA